MGFFKFNLKIYDFPIKPLGIFKVIVFAKSFPFYAVVD